MTDSAQNRFTQWVYPFIVPAILFIASYAALKNDMSHLDRRLTADEAQIQINMTSLDRRLHTVELDTTGRLSAIEARLLIIEDTTEQIRDHLLK